MRTGPAEKRAYYFALPRLFAHFAGRRAGKSEGDRLEALCGSAIVFLIPYLAGLDLGSRCPFFSRRLFAVVLLPVVIGFWLLLLYAHSIFIRLYRSCGLFRSVPDRLLQHVFVCVVLIVLAVDLALSQSPVSWIGLAALTGLTMECFATVALPLANDPLPFQSRE